MKATEKLYSAEQVRALDAYVIEQGIPGEILMQRAGRALFDALLENFDPSEGVHVFCGAGNNGGDGYVVATLAAARGYPVSLYYLKEPAELSGAARTAADVAIENGVSCQAFYKDLPLQLGVIVDALLGTGLERAIEGDYLDAVTSINQSGLPVVAADIPSGLCADTGAVLGSAIHADLTVSFIALKKGLFTGAARDYTGLLVYADLDVPAQTWQQQEMQAQLTSYASLRDEFYSLREPTAHKGDFGHVLIVGGDKGFAGAVMLAAEAALSCGAGLVSVATHEQHLAALLARSPEVMGHAVESGQELQHLLDKVDVVVCGPGLGQTAWSEAMLQQVLAGAQTLVLDADALNLLAAGRLNVDFSDRDVVLTPHPGEAGRLLKLETFEVEQNRYAALEALLANYQATVVLKGAGSLVAEAGQVFVCVDGNPGMASGGMGDVLSGVVAAMLAQGFAENPVAAAVALHAYAADCAAAESGERGLHASELMPWLRVLVNGEDISEMRFEEER